MAKNKKTGPDALGGGGPHEKSTTADDSISVYSDSSSEPRKILVPDGRVIAVSIDLANEVGLVNAALLQQLAYLLFIAPDKGHWYGGRKWVWNTAKDWHTQLPFISEKTLARRFVDLEELGYVHSRQPGAYDRTKHYTVDYAAVDLAVGHKIDGADASLDTIESISQFQEIDIARQGTCTNKEVSKDIADIIIAGEGIHFA